MTFDYLADLNKAQREAVEHGFANGRFTDAGPLLVIAAPAQAKPKRSPIVLLISLSTALIQTAFCC